MSTNPELHIQLRALRARAGVGREVIAERANVAVNTVRNAEMGTPTTLSNLQRIVQAYGYDLRIVKIRKPKPATRLKASDAA